MLERCWKKISSRSFSPKSVSLFYLLLAFSAPFPVQNALAATELIPFILPWDDTSKTVVSAAGLNSPIAAEWVRVSPSGHLVLSAAPQTSDTDPRIRFVGMNMTFEAGLPPREMAPQVAGRLAKFGVNAVRFHHVDNDWCNALLDYSKGDSRHVNAKRLDDFHYFISQLKTNGIYVDMNLLVSRTFKVNDGFPEDLNALSWKTRHILGFFNDHALELQKEYASQILCAVNPYTGLPMAQDPVVAFVEILNENGILQKWKEGDLDQMPPVFQAQLRTRWNEWLKKRYTSAEELRQKWGAQEIPLGPNLLKNADFSESSTKEGSLDIHPWMLENHSGKAELTLDQGHTDGVKALKIKVTQPADLAWHIQLKQSQMSQKAGQLKTISFWAKADKNLKLELNASQEGKTYSNVGLSQSLSLNADKWQHFSFTYVASSTEDNFRPVWGGFANQECTVWISDVRLMDGGTLGDLPKNASLKEGNIPNINFRSGNPAPHTARQDWIEFLISLENRYYQTLCKHLREECGYQGLIFGTILANSPASVQAQMDIIDSHGYWKHPQFPGAEWDSRNWIVENVSMTGYFENTFTSCALQRVKGKPFFCTEYQHPSPNSYNSEAPLIMGAYAALQDWDGFWFFDYGTGNGTADMGKIANFFAMSGHPTQMANMILASHLFRRGDVKPSQEEIVLGMDPETELETLHKAGSWNLATARHLGLPERYALQNRVSMSLGENPKGVTHAKAPEKIEGTKIQSDTGELLWEIPSSGQDSQIQINTLRTKALIGFTDEKEVVLGDVTIRPGKTNLGWSTIAITLLEGENFSSPAHALLIATGQTENTGMKWTNEKKNSVSNQWGSSPVRTECVPFEITLPVQPFRVEVLALDTRGNPVKKCEVREKEGKALIQSSGDTETMWYEIRIRQ